MFIKKVALSLALISSFSSAVYAQQANDCAKLAFAQVQAENKLTALKNEITQLEEAHSAFATMAKGVMGASLSVSAAAIVRSYFASKETQGLMIEYITATDTPAFKEQLRKVGTKSLLIIGAAGVVGALVVTVADAKIYQAKLAELGQQKVELLQKLETAKQRLVEEKVKHNCN